MWRAVDIGLFMKRWILLMKSSEVKTQKKNYLVFLVFIRNCLLAGTFRRNLPGSSVSNQAHLQLSTSQIFQGLMEIRVYLSALTVSFNPLTYTGKYFPRTGQKTGRKFNDALHKYRGFWFRQTRSGGQVPFSSDRPFT